MPSTGIKSAHLIICNINFEMRINIRISLRFLNSLTDSFQLAYILQQHIRTPEIVFGYRIL